MSTFPRIADVTAAFARNIPHADAKRPRDERMDFKERGAK